MQNSNSNMYFVNDALNTFLSMVISALEGAVAYKPE